MYFSSPVSCFNAVADWCKCVCVSLSLPELSETDVLQCYTGVDAFIWIIGQHLVEQRQTGRRALRDQLREPTAFPRQKIEVHSTRPYLHQRRALLRQNDLFTVHYRVYVVSFLLHISKSLLHALK